MSGALAFLAVFGIGAALGWWLKGGVSSARRRVLIGVAIVFGAPIALFAVAMVVGHEVLAWIAGLSLMIVVGAAVPLCLGVLLGWNLLGRSRRRETSANEQSASSRPVSSTPAATVNAAPASVPQHSPAAPTHLRTLLLPAAAVASGFWVVIALGFRLHDQPAPMGLDRGLIPAALVFIATVSLGLRAVWKRRGGRIFVLSARRDAREQAEAVAKRQAWIDAIAVDPRRQRYAAMIAAGDNSWTPERVEYDLDPRATACCEHFAPIESAMRAAGLKVHLAGPSTASAKCVIDPEALAQQFPLPEGIGYQEWYSRDRSGDDPPHALLFCPPHYSRLWVLHAREAAPGTPTFPSNAATSG